MAAGETVHLSLEERRAKGGKARERVPLAGHSGWRPAADRPDPVALLEAQDLTREPDLVPVRHGRMMVSPFTFYRGAAKIMAADLGSMPTAGLGVQLCGDAHLLNFGAYASPERRLVFDLNDFDETLPGPFEYDVKRMAASFTIAARDNGYSGADTRAATLASVTAYREAMAGFAQLRTLDIWYAQLPEDELMTAVRGTVADMARAARGKQGKKKAKTAEKTAQRGEKLARKARTRDSLQALSRLGELAGGRYRIVSQPPVIVPARDLAATYGIAPDVIGQVIRDQLRAYRATCSWTGATCLSISRSWTWPARSSAWAASGPGRSSCCCKGATPRTRCSCRSRRPPPRYWRTICPAAASPSPASASCRDSE